VLFLAGGPGFCAEKVWVPRPRFGRVGPGVDFLCRVPGAPGSVFRTWVLGCGCFSPIPDLRSLLSGRRLSFLLTIYYSMVN